VTRILVIAAHPDDASLGCGGYLQHADHKRILCLTHGENGGDYAKRTEEELAASVVLGASLSWGHNTIDRYLKLDSAVNSIEAELVNYEPDAVLTMAAHDTHQDHRTAHEATMIACRDFAGTVLAYPGPSSALGFSPTWFVPLTDAEMRVKLAALACHKTQAHRSYTSPEYVEGMARYWAMVTRSRAQFVEPYETVRAWTV
jgi:LmbE family N-acetylglucosaminyl deacetylase